MYGGQERVNNMYQCLTRDYGIWETISAVCLRGKVWPCFRKCLPVHADINRAHALDVSFPCDGAPRRPSHRSVEVRPHRFRRCQPYPTTTKCI